MPIPGALDGFAGAAGGLRSPRPNAEYMYGRDVGRNGPDLPVGPQFARERTVAGRARRFGGVPLDCYVYAWTRGICFMLPL